jgi:hypothetical protein
MIFNLLAAIFIIVTIIIMGVMPIYAGYLHKRDD